MEKQNEIFKQLDKIRSNLNSGGSHPKYDENDLNYNNDDFENKRKEIYEKYTSSSGLPEKRDQKIYKDEEIKFTQ